MRTKGILKGKEIVLEKDFGIEGEVEVELTFSDEVEKEAFGIWQGRKDIEDSTTWIRIKRNRMAEILIFDTDILIDYLLGIEDAKTFFASFPKTDRYTTAISLMEI